MRRTSSVIAPTSTRSCSHQPVLDAPRGLADRHHEIDAGPGDRGREAGASDELARRPEHGEQRQLVGGVVEIDLGGEHVAREEQADVVGLIGGLQEQVALVVARQTEVGQDAPRGGKEQGAVRGPGVSDATSQVTRSFSQPRASAPLTRTLR